MLYVYTPLRRAATAAAVECAPYGCRSLLRLQSRVFTRPCERRVGAAALGALMVPPRRPLGERTAARRILEFTTFSAAVSPTVTDIRSPCGANPRYAPLAACATVPR